MTTLKQFLSALEVLQADPDLAPEDKALFALAARRSVERALRREWRRRRDRILNGASAAMDLRN